MNIGKTVSGQRMILHLDGRFDFATHRDFREAMKETIANPAIHGIQIDLTKVSYVDSSALGMLLLTRENAKAAGKTLSLAHPQGTVRDVLRIANFGTLFTIE